MTILPKSRLVQTATSDGRCIYKSAPGAMPSAAEVHAGHVGENIRPLSQVESDALFARIEAMIGGARRDLAAAKEVRS